MTVHATSNRSTSLLRRLAGALAVLACIAVLAVPASAEVTAEDLAGEWTFAYEQELPVVFGHASVESGLFSGFGSFALDELGTVTGRRVLLRPRAVGTQLGPVFEEIEQTLTGTYTVDADGIGAMQVSVGNRPDWYSHLDSPDPRYVAAASETVRFVASNGGRNLELFVKATAEKHFTGAAVRVMEFRMRGEARRLDAASPPTPMTPMLRGVR